MKESALALLALALTMLHAAHAAHAADASDAWPILATATQSQCAWSVRDAAVRTIDSEAQWKALFPAGQQVFAHPPDWTRQLVVVLTVGTRPTTGYSIELIGKQFRQQGDKLLLDFREHLPGAGQFLQQVMTQPCVLILTERGKWRQVIFENADTGAALRADTVPSPSPGSADKPSENPPGH